MPNPLLPSLPHTIPQAFARMEGFYVEGPTPNRPQRNHNPGDIEYGIFATHFGATGTDGRFAIFPDDETGMFCLITLLSGPVYRNLTLEAGINKYAPPVENQTNEYVALVCQWSGRQPTDIIGDYVSAPAQ